MEWPQLRIYWPGSPHRLWHTPLPIWWHFQLMFDLAHETVLYVSHEGRIDQQGKWQVSKEVAGLAGFKSWPSKTQHICSVASILTRCPLVRMLCISPLPDAKQTMPYVWLFVWLSVCHACSSHNFQGLQQGQFEDLEGKVVGTIQSVLFPPPPNASWPVFSIFSPLHHSPACNACCVPLPDMCVFVQTSQTISKDTTKTDNNNKIISYHDSKLLPSPIHTTISINSCRVIEAYMHQHYCKLQ